MQTAMIYEGEDGSYMRSDKAFEYCKLVDFRDRICIYGENRKTVNEEIQKLFDNLYLHNKSFSNIREQILATNPYEFEGVVNTSTGSKYVIAYIIGFKRYTERTDYYVESGRYNYKVLYNYDDSKYESKRDINSTITVVQPSNLLNNGKWFNTLKTTRKENYGT